MSYENNNVHKDDIENLRMKILDIGMYEIGMSVQEMKDLLEIVQQSEQTASQENEYRSTLLDTEKNCADISLLISDSEPPKEIENNITDKTVLSNDIESRSRISFDVKCKNKASNITMSDNSITIIDSNITNDNVIQMSTFNDHLEDKKNIDVFMPNMCYKGNLERKTNNSNLLLPFYCRPEIRHMPVELAAIAIDKYHQTVHDQYIQMQRKSLALPKWGKSIPGIVMDKDQQSSTDSMLNCLKNNNILGRRACNIKRKMYRESSSDDDSILNKKSKEVLPKYLEDKLEKASVRKRVQINDYESHADKIFDDLIVQGDQKESNNKSKHVYNTLSSSDDDINPKIIISAMVHNEKTPVKRNFKMLRDKKLIVKSKNTEDLDSISSANDISCPSETNEECHSTKHFTRSATKREDSNDLEFQLVDNELNALEPVSSKGDKPYKRRAVLPYPLHNNLSQRTQKIISNIKKKRKNPKCVTKPEYQICNDKDSVEEGEITKILEIPTDIFYNSNKNNEDCIVLDDEYTCPLCNKNINMSIIKQHIINCSKSKLQIMDESSGIHCFYCREYIAGNYEEHLEDCEEKT